ncbi:MAG: carboxypeptidase regulatory-like domain-containing protein, partial [Liquorilactobacillus satsumensis]
DQTVTYNAKLKLVGLDYTDLGNVSGAVHDAVTNNGLDNVELSYRSGLNDTTGQVVNTASTDEDGNYQVKLPGGNYTMEMKKDGYVVGYQNILATGHQDSNNQNGILTPSSSNYAYRIVLQWGENPNDLDSHLTGPMSDGNGRFHLYFRNKDYQDDGTDAELDVDDTTSYGPETVTIIKEMVSGTYTYAVHKYAGGGELANSDATVKVYRGTNLVEEYNVPNQSGNLWNVFQISNGQIQTINQMATIDDQIPTISELKPM